MTAPVTEAEKQEIFKCIRWNLMTHEQLVECSMDKDFEMARQYILDGLSNRLVNFEKSTKLGDTFKTNARQKYDKSDVGLMLSCHADHKAKDVPELAE